MVLVGLLSTSAFSIAPATQQQQPPFLSNASAPTGAALRPSSLSSASSQSHSGPILETERKKWRQSTRRNTNRERSVAARTSSAPAYLLSDTSLDAMENDSEEGFSEKTVDVELLACPICFLPLARNGVPGLNQRAITRSGFQCRSCKKAYSSRNAFLDLTISADARVYSEAPEKSEEFFNNPVISFVYERGWRQSFLRAGFPGPEEEVKMAQEYFKPTYGGVLLDVSCGSGLFTRRFAKLDLFSAVVAIDFAENMLLQAFDYIDQEPALLDKTIALVRADVARMPFATGTVDAVHAGAALHCWPSPASGMAEISRILRPGGVFVATTFLNVGPINFLRGIAQALGMPTAQQLGPSIRYWQEAELEDLMRISGLVNYQRIRRQGFIMLTATKPE